MAEPTPEELIDRLKLTDDELIAVIRSRAGELALPRAAADRATRKAQYGLASYLWGFLSDLPTDWKWREAVFEILTEARNA